MKLILYIIIIYFLLDIFNSTPFKEHFEKTHYDVAFLLDFGNDLKSQTSYKLDRRIHTVI